VLEVVDPPGETFQEDLQAVKRATERMRESGSMPEATIDLIYVREVTPKSKDMQRRQKEPYAVDASKKY
jgi:hypothetical protein